MIREVVANSLGKKARAKLSMHPVGGEFEGHECVAKQAPVRSLTPSARELRREGGFVGEKAKGVHTAGSCPSRRPTR
jgi:hypothetical protein